MQVAGATLLGLLMIPSPPPLSSFHVFLVNHPAWSLFFEMVANLAYAAVAPHLTNRRLASIIAVAALALVLWALWDGSMNAGWSWPKFAGGFPRVIFGFFAGVLLQRMPARAPVVSDWGAIAAAVALIAILLPVGDPSRLQLPFEFVLLPAIVWLASQVEPGRILTPVAEWLGRTSYAIYALHLPLMLWTVSLSQIALHGKLSAGLGYPAVFGVILVAATVADRFWDIPLRRVLRRWSAPIKEPRAETA
jgi:peptidoglycan/LPS O-acetylase OafA/YrhL